MAYEEFDMHTFEQSGLGIAPFKVVSPEKHFLLKHGVLFCEHCGTQIKNRHFIESSNGVVSVVGIDCLKKTGDQGLVDGERRIKRELAAKERMAEEALKTAAREAKERAKYNGRTINEIKENLSSQIIALRSSLRDELDMHAIINDLVRVGFEEDMRVQAYQEQVYSPNQLRVIKEVIARKVSCARKNTKAYKAALVKVSPQVDELQSLLQNFVNATNKIRDEINKY